MDESFAVVSSDIVIRHEETWVFSVGLEGGPFSGIGESLVQPDESNLHGNGFSDSPFECIQQYLRCAIRVAGQHHTLRIVYFD